MSPEGTTIEIDSAGPWTVGDVHRMLVENGLDSLVGPSITVKVQDVYASQTTASAAAVSGRYTSFTATIYLKGVNSSFASAPNAILGHEFGHAWTLYHLYLSQGGDWSRYLAIRDFDDEQRLDTSYGWSRQELIADDYRLLLGSDASRSEMPRYINSQAAPPSTIPGLDKWFKTVWAAKPAPGATSSPTSAPSVTVTPTAAPASPTGTVAPSATPDPSPIASVAPEPSSSAVPGTPDPGTPEPAPPAPSPTPTTTVTPVPTPPSTDAPTADVVTGLGASPVTVVFSTTITFEMRAAGHVTVRILNKHGQPVRVLADGAMAPGGVVVTWDRAGERGKRVPKGPYTVEVRSEAAAGLDLDTLEISVE